MKRVGAIIFLFILSLTALAQSNKRADSITVAIAPEYDDVSGFHRFWLGEGYRKVWATPVKLRVIDLSKEHGGLKITKLGGGMQTRSLRLEDPKGREWVLRTVQKYPERSLPASLRPTIAKDIVQDQVSTNHPFAALVVPPLATVLGIPHSNPELVFVGDDPALGEYRKDFSNAVYLLEERAPLEAEDTDNTEKVQDKIQDDNDTSADQKLTLRSRLLDFLLGDWDRHEDNWRWEQRKKGDETVYIPVPRDRDKVFYKTTGVIPWLLNHQWLKTHLQPYSPDIRGVKYWNFNERYFDRYFLNELSLEDWQAEVKFVQRKLTPELVEESFKLMPQNVFALNGEELLFNFLSRREKLDSLATEYYNFLSINVDVPGSDKKELFDVRTGEGGSISVTVNNIKKDGTKGRMVYQRTFDPAVTKEVRLFGIGGEDVFSVEGQSKSPVKVRMIGGDDEDKFIVSEAAVNNRKLFIYDRSDEKNELPASSAARLRLSKDTAVNTFNKRSFLYDRYGALFSLNYNPDQGIQLGVGYLFEKQAFKKAPYGSKQELWAHYATGRESFSFDYTGDFKKVIKDFDLNIDARYQGPRNQANFFGIGNNTVFEQDDVDIEDDEELDRGIDYYRNRFDFLSLDVKLKKAIAKNFAFEAGITGSYYTSDIENNDERFFSDFNASNPDENVFDDNIYAGVQAGLVYDTREVGFIPKKGLFWETSFQVQTRLDGTSRSYSKLSTEMVFYLNPGKGGLVIANRLGGGTTFGDPLFFQRMRLGGLNNLRGFRTNRFAGRSSAYYNLDLRLKLFDFTSYLVPGTIGLVGFNDVGRVWEPGETSNTVHHGYGGGLYITPGEFILLQGSIGFSKESTMGYLSIGFHF